ncbi:MAG: preQ(1) synthase [Oscillospiraceae bacterium]|nr:preQ(1) synthase [Oscillospiraceae bacterium]
MSRTSEELEGVISLGSGFSDYKSEYDPGLLETFTNKHPDIDYTVEFECPEFTSLCPLTGQPDFGIITIRYIPSKKMLESKSLKLYLFSFRNNGDFHEDCVNIILKDLRKILSPKYIEVRGKFNARGGISIHPFSCWGIKDSEYEKTAQKRLLQ